MVCEPLDFFEVSVMINDGKERQESDINWPSSVHRKEANQKIVDMKSENQQRE